MKKDKASKKNKFNPLLTVFITLAAISGLFLLFVNFIPSLKVLWTVLTLLLCAAAMFIIGKKAGKNDVAEQSIPLPEETLSESEKILKEGNRALSEMGKLYMSIQNNEIRQKINEIMRLTDKITQDSKEDPSDIPQIKKFMNFYLPTTIKLLHSYDRMSNQEIQGDNLEKSMSSIIEMLDVSIEAYKKLLDGLFENQALDVETDINVMNTLLAREGLSDTKDFSL